MKKTKSFILFEENDVRIKCIVSNNGIIKMCNYIIYFGNNTREYKKQYAIDNKDALKRYKSEYYQKHIERIHKQHKKYYKENVEIYKNRAATWKLNNKDKVSINSTKYNAKRKQWGIPIIFNEWFENAHLHHLHYNGDTEICIYIPSDLHQSIWHSHKNIETMSAINKISERWFDTESENNLEGFEPYDIYRDDMLTEYIEHELTVKPIPNIKGTTQLFEDEE